MIDSIERIWCGDLFQGTTVVYAATPDQHLADQCDFHISLLTETSPKKVRAYREDARRKGEIANPLSPNDLSGELVVVVGAEMSATEVVATLERLAREIRRTGLLIGRDMNDDYKSEFANPNANCALGK